MNYFVTDFVDWTDVLRSEIPVNVTIKQQNPLSISRYRKVCQPLSELFATRENIIVSIMIRLFICGICSTKPSNFLTYSSENELIFLNPVAHLYHFVVHQTLLFSMLSNALCRIETDQPFCLAKFYLNNFSGCRTRVWPLSCAGVPPFAPPPLHLTGLGVSGFEKFHSLRRKSCLGCRTMKCF